MHTSGFSNRGPTYPLGNNWLQYYFLQAELYSPTCHSPHYSVLDPNTDAE